MQRLLSETGNSVNAFKILIYSLSHMQTYKCFESITPRIAIWLESDKKCVRVRVPIEADREGNAIHLCVTGRMTTQQKQQQTFH